MRRQLEQIEVRGIVKGVELEGGGLRSDLQHRRSLHDSKAAGTAGRGTVAEKLARRPLVVLVPAVVAGVGRGTEIGPPELGDDAIGRALARAFGRGRQSGFGGLAEGGAVG